jgi:hypothetical protein
MRRRREEEEKKEKMQLLHKLYQYEQRGHRMANSYSMDSNIDELRFEVAKIRNEENAKRSVKWYKVIMMVLVSTVETLNTRFDPFGLRLKGWSKDMNEKKEDLDDSFHRLHDKYSSKSTIEPEWELAFAFFGGAFMYHLQNAAENYGELGGMLSAIAGGSGGGGGGGANSGKSHQASAGNRPGMSKTAGWHPGTATNIPMNDGSQQSIMTNMPLFQQQPLQQPPQYQQAPPQPPQYQQASPQQPQTPAVGKTGRRIMNGPPLPAGGGMVGMNVMSMMSGMNDFEENSDDVPIDFSLPPTVGGAKTGPTPPSHVRPTSAGTNASRPVVSKSPLSSPTARRGPTSSTQKSASSARSRPTPPTKSSNAARPLGSPISSERKKPRDGGLQL